MTRVSRHCDDHVRLWLRVVRGDDADAFGCLYREYWRRVVGFLAGCGGNHAPLEDLAQEVFTRAWECRRSFHGDSSVETYLFGIARNVLSEHRWNHRRDMLFLKELLNGIRPSGSSISSDRPESDFGPQLSRAVEAARTRLTDRQREALELDQILDLPRRQAVNLANCTPRQFADRLYRAKKRLKQLLEHLLPCLLL